MNDNTEFLLKLTGYYKPNNTNIIVNSQDNISNDYDNTGYDIRFVFSFFDV